MGGVSRIREASRSVGGADGSTEVVVPLVGLGGVVEGLRITWLGQGWVGKVQPWG